MLSCHADPAEPEGSIRCKGAAPFWSLALDVDLAAARERPVLPGRFLEHNHCILRVVPGRGETGHKVRQELLLHLDAAPRGQKDLDKHKVICSTALNVRVV